MLTIFHVRNDDKGLQLYTPQQLFIHRTIQILKVLNIRANFFVNMHEKEGDINDTCIINV